jgi:hypothetical protein
MTRIVFSAAGLLLMFVLAGCGSFGGGVSVSPATASAARTVEPVAVQTSTDAGGFAVEVPAWPEERNTQDGTRNTEHGTRDPDSLPGSGFQATGSASPGSGFQATGSASPGSGFPATGSVPTAPAEIRFEFQGRPVSIAALPGLRLFVRGPSTTSVQGERSAATASGKGVGVRGGSDKTDLKSLAAPEVDLGKGGPSAAGGGLKGLSAKMLSTSKGALIFYAVGGLLIVAGVVVVVWLKQTALGLALTGAGVLLIGAGVCIERFPWVFLIPVVLLLGGLVWFILYARKHGGAMAALKTIIYGVETAPAAASEVVKASIAAAAPAVGAAAATVKAVVSAAKTAIGLNGPKEKG